MTPVVLVVLALMWAVVGVSWLRSRSDRRGVNSISSFARHLSVLERTSPSGTGYDYRTGAASRPANSFSARLAAASSIDLATARRRRRNVLLALAGTAVGALVLIPFLGGLAVTVHVLADVLLVAYVVLLVRTQRLAAERRAKVRYLHPLSASSAERVSVPHQSAI